MIIIGFACVGKTYLANKNKNVIDFQSTPYHYKISENVDSEKIKGGEHNFDINEKWPQNFVNEMLKLDKQKKIVLVSFRQNIIDILNELNVNYLIVLPEKKQKLEYIERAKKRNNTKDFVKGFEERFDKWIDVLNKQDKEKIILRSGEFLEDVLKRKNII